MSEETMEALVLRRPGVAGLGIERRPVPEPKPGEVTIRVAACGVGRTVLNKINQAGEGSLPLVPGHEASGWIVAAGEGVPAERVGEYVLVYYYVSCGACEHCLAGQQPLCTRASPSGQAVKVGENLDGAYAEYVALPARNALAAPVTLDPVAATVVPDAVATPIHVCRRAGLRSGERIGVIGAAGGVGAHLVQVAALGGAAVAAIDLGDKLDALADYGASELVAGDDPDWPQRLSAPLDVAVDLVGTEETLRAAVRSLGRGGRLVLLTVDPQRTFAVAPIEMVGRELSILGSRYASHSEVSEAARLVDSGAVTPLITREGSLSDVSSMLNDIEAHRFLGRGALVFAGAGPAGSQR